MAKESEGSKNPKLLPFDRIGFDKQLEILRSISMFFEEQNSAASYTDVSPLVGIAATSISGCLRFWQSTGLIIGKDKKYVPSRVLLNFTKNESEDTRKNLGIFLKATWFVVSVKIHLRMKELLTEEEIINTLSKAYDPLGKLSPSAKALKILFEILVFMEIVKREENGYSLLDTPLSYSEEIDLPTKTNLVQVRVEERIFAIDRDQLIEFIETNGRELSREIKLR